MDSTHVEDMKDSIEVLLPSGDGILITFCMEEPRGRVPFPLLDNLLLDPGHSPASRP